MVIIPNSVIAKELIINYDFPSKLHRQKIEVGVGYQTPPSLVRQALLEAARSEKGVLDNPAPDVHLTDYDEYSINYELRYWLADYEQVEEIRSRILAQIYEVFKRRGIRIPFPIQDVYLYRGKEEKPSHRPPHLVVVEGWRAGTCIELAGGEVLLGRGPDCSFQINDPVVSKHHARIKAEKEGVFVEDLGSKTGTRVNNVRVKRQQIREGDEVQIGSTRLLFEEH